MITPIYGGRHFENIRGFSVYFVYNLVERKLGKEVMVCRNGKL